MAFPRGITISRPRRLKQNGTTSPIRLSFDARLGDAVVLLSKVLDQLIAITRRQQELARKNGIHNSLTSLNWIKEMCVIRLGSARQTGHTFACYSIVEQFKAGGKRAIATAPRANCFGPLSKLIGKVHCPEAALDEEHIYDLIAVDCASHMSIDRLNELYSRLSDRVKPGQEFFLCLVG